MRVKREEFLCSLEAVAHGLAKREAVEQSTCFVFRDDQVVTYNDEIACRRVSLLNGFVGAVPAKPLLDTMRKWVDEEIDIEQTESEMLIKGAGRRAGIRMEKETTLPIDNVEQPDTWLKLNPEFGDAVAVVGECAGTDDNQFVLTCVHITPTHLEACDNLQLARYPLETGFTRPTLVRHDSLKVIVGLDMTEFSETANWLHFRNPAGLMISSRRYLEDYPSLDGPLDVQGPPTTLPGGLAEAVAKAEVFSSEDAGSNNVLIDIRDGRLVVEGRGVTGWFQEKKQIKYDGDPLRFKISPKLLVEVSKKTNECVIVPKRLLIDGGKFKCVCCLSVV